MFVSQIIPVCQSQCLNLEMSKIQRYDEITMVKYYINWSKKLLIFAQFSVLTNWYMKKMLVLQSKLFKHLSWVKIQHNYTFSFHV